MSLLRKDIPREEQNVKKSKILMTGIGLSTFGEDMFEDGYHNIIAVDYSEECIKRWHQYHNEKVHNNNSGGVVYQVMDITDMSNDIDDSSIDYIIDKATLDTIYNQGLDKVKIVLNEYARIVKPNGNLILISYGDLEMRQKVLH